MVILCLGVHMFMYLHHLEHDFVNKSAANGPPVTVVSAVLEILSLSITS